MESIENFGKNQFTITSDLIIDSGAKNEENKGQRIRGYKLLRKEGFMGYLRLMKPIMIIVFLLFIFGSAQPVSGATTARLGCGPESSLRAIIWKWYPVHYQDMVRRFMAKLKSSLAIVHRNWNDPRTIRYRTQTRMRQVQDQMRITQQRQGMMTVNHQDRLRSMRDRSEMLLRQQRLRTQALKAQ